jgi:hypothetical protein
VKNNKKSPLLVNKKGLGISKSYLIFQGISTLLELAPASAAGEPVAVASSGQSLRHSG